MLSFAGTTKILPYGIVSCYSVSGFSVASATNNYSHIYSIPFICVSDKGTGGGALAMDSHNQRSQLEICIYCHHLEVKRRAL